VEIALTSDIESELGKAGLWTVMQIRNAVEEFRLQLVRSAHFNMSDGRLGWVDHVVGTSIRTEVRHGIEKSEKWRRYQDQLLLIGEPVVMGVFSSGPCSA
jgi:hypothetical protein